MILLFITNLRIKKYIFFIIMLINTGKNLRIKQLTLSLRLIICKTMRTI